MLCQLSIVGPTLLETHKLVGATPPGRFHIRNCGLNAPHLVQERKERAEMWDLIEKHWISIKSSKSVADIPAMLELIESLKRQAMQMIPRIEYLSGDALANYRAQEKALEAISE